jgi:hypothetical protein
MTEAILPVGLSDRGVTLRLLLDANLVGVAFTLFSALLADGLPVRIFIFLVAHPVSDGALVGPHFALVLEILAQLFFVCNLCLSVAIHH